MGKIDNAMHFTAELCDTCSRADLTVAKMVCKLIYDLAETRRISLHCK